MNVSEPRSTSASSQTAVVAAVPEEGDPQRSEPQQPGRLRSALAHLFRLRRGKVSLRENLEDELARDDAGDQTFTPEERMLLGNILRLRELRVDDVMVPRADIDAVDDSISLGHLMQLFQENGHSRMPVYHDTLDDPRGMVHIKDLMSYIAAMAAITPNASAANDTSDEDQHPDPQSNLALNLAQVDLTRTLAETDMLRNVLFVPPSMPATDLMAKMQAGRVQMALVIDEYGGTDGLISMEDLVETVVGDIEDEHDEDEEAMLVPSGEGVWVADPRIPLEDLEEKLGTKFSVEGHDIEEVDTLGGLLFTLVGRVPVRGELIASRDVPGFEFEILDADPRRIKRARLRRKRPEPRILDQRRRHTHKRPETPENETSGEENLEEEKSRASAS